MDKFTAALIYLLNIFYWNGTIEMPIEYYIYTKQCLKTFALKNLTQFLFKEKMRRLACICKFKKASQSQTKTDEYGILWLRFHFFCLCLDLCYITDKQSVQEKNQYPKTQIKTSKYQ